MDVIKFKLSDYEENRVITIINGTKLNKFVYKTELKADVREKVYDGNSYGDGIYSGWLYYDLAAESYVPYISSSYTLVAECGNTTSRDAEENCAAVLGCACGADRCSQYCVRITKTENSIIWDDYFALKFNEPNYFHFEFEKKQYYEEVEKLIDLTLQMGRFDGLPTEIIKEIKANNFDFEEQFLGQKKHYKFY